MGWRLLVRTYQHEHVPASKAAVNQTSPSGGICVVYLLKQVRPSPPSPTPLRACVWRVQG